MVYMSYMKFQVLIGKPNITLSLTGILQNHNNDISIIENGAITSRDFESHRQYLKPITDR